MPNLVKQIPETMRKQGIPEEIISKFNIPGTSGANDVMTLISQMDKLLAKEQRLSVMQEQGCCTTGKPAAAHRAFGQKYKDKPLREKIDLLHELDTVHNPPCRLNDDGTLSVFWGDASNPSCPCGFIRKLPKDFEVSPTFCACCGGHARQNLQKSLGVSLRLLEVVSSVSSSGGKKRCEFLYKVIDSKSINIDDIKDELKGEERAAADEFFALAGQYGLKPTVRYAAWKRSWKCVFTQKKPKRVIFTIETAPGSFTVKACLFNIGQYLHKHTLPEAVKSQLVHDRNWNCGNCNETCRKGVPFSLDGRDYYKCIGGAFTLGPLNASDWKLARELIKEELGIREITEG